MEVERSGFAVDVLLTGRPSALAVLIVVLRQSPREFVGLESPEGS
jgi:hypothetical protein